jgi:GTP-binding protein HflX
MVNLQQILRVLPIHVISPRLTPQVALNLGEELESLITTVGGKVVDRVIQKLDKPDSATYIGSGKVEQVAQKLKSLEVDVVVLNARAKPRQIHHLLTEWQKVIPGIQVWDRVDLILNIFERHAVTTEAKLQIEMARMKYMGPRIYGMGFVLSRQGGGIGTSGIGETNTELMKRHWRREVKRVSDQLEKVSQNKKKQLESRKSAGFSTVSIVGYTNAGKSSLFNALTGKNARVADVLFATLDSSVGKMFIPDLQKEILVSDTIGFIRNLPPQLIEAFKSTLLETIHADIILHVIDAVDPEVHVKILVVNEILGELGIESQKVIYIFNKLDFVPHLNQEYFKSLYHENSPLFLSVKSKEGLGFISDAIKNKLKHTS